MYSALFLLTVATLALAQDDVRGQNTDLHLRCMCTGSNGQLPGADGKITALDGTKLPADFGESCKVHEDSGEEEEWCYIDPCFCSGPDDWVEETFFEAVKLTSRVDKQKLYRSKQACNPDIKKFGRAVCATFANEADCTEGGCTWERNMCNIAPTAVAIRKEAKCDEINWGSPGCRCLGYNGQPRFRVEGSSIPHVFVTKENASLLTLDYQSDYGQFCGVHAEDGAPSCQPDYFNPNTNTTGPAEWCGQEWCYVDPCTCASAFDDVAASDYFRKGAKGSVLYYSYKSCDPSAINFFISDQCEMTEPGMTMLVDDPECEMNRKRNVLQAATTAANTTAVVGTTTAQAANATVVVGTTTAPAANTTAAAGTTAAPAANTTAAAGTTTAAGAGSTATAAPTTTAATTAEATTAPAGECKKVMVQCGDGDDGCEKTCSAVMLTDESSQCAYDKDTGKCTIDRSRVLKIKQTETCGETRGRRECRCLYSSADFQSPQTDDMGRFIVSKNNVDGTAGERYDASWGKRCEPHYDTYTAECDTKYPPEWCYRSWCYVDPCSCLDSGLIEDLTFYDPEAEDDDKGVVLFRSYATCGRNDEWDARVTDVERSETDCRSFTEKVPLADLDKTPMSTEDDDTPASTLFISSALIAVVTALSL